ncbi:unnamed protein product [Ectocarpus sp. CCAP 1310/34]|nr:unnamed protein product [Ectocarpus sp. CCAP 1310/34]
MPGKMLSRFVMMTLMGIAAGTPHPECEPCAAVAKAELEALDLNDKYLCCDLTCAQTPVAGCGIFGLPLVCKACYDGDGTPAYDDDPVDGDGTTPSTTPAPATAEPVTAEPVTAEPVMPVAAPTPEMPVASPTLEPVMPVMPVTTPTPEPVMPVAGPTSEPEPEPDMSMSYDFDDCSPCEEATEILTMEDWIALENDGLELVCDPDCYENSMLDGCGAFGLDTECRTVEIDDGEGEGGGEGGGTTSSETGAGGGEGGGTTSSETGAGGGEGGGTTSSETGEGGGEGGGVTSSQTGEGEGEGEGGGGDTTSGSCTDAEIAMCADISPAQEEALAMYDGGGKVIVCDPTCLGGDISHCNYFGLGQLCRGCGSCSECVPCP